MKQNGRSISSYFILIIFLLIVIWFLTYYSSRSEADYSRTELVAALEAGNVAEVKVCPNEKTPTGYLEIELKSGVTKKLYATDISDLEQLVRDYGIDPYVTEVKGDSWIATTVVPLLIVLAAGAFMMMLFNAQNANSTGNRMMNFGKSRATLIMGNYQKMNFSQV